MGRISKDALEFAKIQILRILELGPATSLFLSKNVIYVGSSFTAPKIAHIMILLHKENKVRKISKPRRKSAYGGIYNIWELIK